MGSLSAPVDLQIPVIDISGNLDGDKEQARSIATELRAACQSPGFFQIVGHHVSSDLRAVLLQKLADFFALPAAEKQSLHHSQSKCLRGYEQVGEQRLETAFSDQKEGFIIGPELPAEARFLHSPNQWPRDDWVPGFTDTFSRYFEGVLDLSKVMFRLMALSLSLDEDYFDHFVGSKDSVSMCQAHRYPPTTPDMAERSRGIGAHTDFGGLTLLLQDDVGGLEVFHKASQTWHRVQPVTDAFVVNIGDMMERWTNNMYTSPMSQRHRYSVAFFNEGLLDQMIECIPTCLKAGDQPLHEPIRAEDHLQQRYGRSY